MKKIPTQRHHKPSGRSVVTLVDRVTGKRRDVYLGVWGTAEAAVEYARVVKDWQDGGYMVERPAREAQADAAPPTPAVVTVSDVLKGHYAAVKMRYGGTMTGHVYNVRAAQRMARSLFGKLPAARFGPRALVKVRDAMAEKGWRRKTVNVRLRFIIAGFRWGVQHELVKAPVWQALTAVEGLTRISHHFGSAILR